MEISIVLVEPEVPGNIGAIARVMMNFGFEDLILLNPRADYLGEEAKERAMHAKPILENLKVLNNWEELKSRFDFLIGTTGKRASKYNLRRIALSSEEFTELIKNKQARIGLVFGRERIGLRNEEIGECDFLVSVKTSEEYPVMNLSHAVAVLLYEIYKHRYTEPLYEPAGREVREALVDWTRKVLDLTEVERKAPIISTFRRIISRSMIKEREAFTLSGLFRNIYNKIKKSS